MAKVEAKRWPGFEIEMIFKVVRVGRGLVDSLYREFVLRLDACTALAKGSNFLCQLPCIQLGIKRLGFRT